MSQNSISTFILTILLLGALLPTCYGQQSANIPTGMDHCESALSVVQNQEYADWSGFGSDCNWTSLTGPLPEDWSEIPSSPLGTSWRNAQKILLSLENYYRPFLYFVDGKPILFEGMNPELVDLENLLQVLGDPETRLDWDFGTLPITMGESVYPRKGITLFMNSNGDKLLHIGLYEPTSLEAYLEMIRPSFRKVRRPYSR